MAITVSIHSANIDTNPIIFIVLERYLQISYRIVARSGSILTIPSDPDRFEVKGPADRIVIYRSLSIQVLVYSGELALVIGEKRVWSINNAADWVYNQRRHLLITLLFCHRPEQSQRTVGQHRWQTMPDLVVGVDQIPWVTTWTMWSMYAAKRSAQSRRQEEQGKAPKSELNANLGSSDVVGGKEKTRRKKKSRARQTCLRSSAVPALLAAGTAPITVHARINSNGENHQQAQKSKNKTAHLLSHLRTGQKRDVVLREMAYTHRTGCTEKKRKTLRNE